MSHFTVSSQHSHINCLSKTSSLTFGQVKLHLNRKKDEKHILNLYRWSKCPVEWQIRWKCDLQVLREGTKIGLVTRSPNCAAPLSSKLLASNGSSSLAPLIQQLIRPDSLSLQNNLNFLKLTSGKAKKHRAQHAVRVISNQQH